MKNLLFIGFLALNLPFLSAQKDVKNQKVSFAYIAPTFGTYVASGDYSEYFGTHFNLGGVLAYKTKNNFVFALDASFIFGNDVDSDSMLKHVRTEDNEVLDEDAKQSIILFFHRGYSLVGTVSKIVPELFGKNQNSGITFGAGLGFLQHKIRVENQNNRIPFLDGEYEKGYDRLTNGLVLKQSIGYTNFSDNKLTNFYIGLEISEGFTKNRRDYNFDLDGPDKKARLDIYAGLRVSWIIPLYSRISTEYYID